MLSTAIQILAFGLALLGVLGAAAATLLPNWKVSGGVWSGVMTPVTRMQGLWMDCVWYSSGVFSCTMKDSVLLLPACLQATRAAMALCCAVAPLGLCLASLGLKCTRWGGGPRAKGHTAAAGGGCLVLAGLLCLGPASWYTNDVVAAFLAADVPPGSRYRPGGALCVSFLSAGFLLGGGVVFCLSCPRPGTRRPDRARPAACRRGQGLKAEPENKIKRVRLQVKLQNPPEPERNHKGYPSPSRPPRDIRDRYCLQEYV